MLRKKRVGVKKFIGLLALMALGTSVGSYSGWKAAVPDTSSSMRQFIIGSEDEAFYVVSASEDVPAPEMETETVPVPDDLPMQEMQTVSGNADGSSLTEAGEVFAQVNQARVNIGLPELAWSDELAAAAEVRAQEIHQSFSHTRPDGSPWWTANSEIIYGENIAKGYQTADSVVTAWMESSEHKDNILYSGFQSIGIAVYSVDGKWYWAQEFGY